MLNAAPRFLKNPFWSVLIMLGKTWFILEASAFAAIL